MARRTPSNFLDHVPRRTAESITGDDGLVTVLAPKFGTGITGRAAKRLLGRRAFVKLHLDDLGTTTWNTIDGSLTVGEIAERVFPDGSIVVGDRYVRSSKFIGMLVRIGAVTVSSPS